MRKGKELILALKDYAVDNKWRSWWCFLSTAALVALTVAGVLVAPHWTGQIACSIVTGLLLVRLFVIYHDHQHNTILNQSGMADFLMRIFGILILAPSSIWKSSHNYHHNHNSKLRSAHIGSFPIMTKEKFLSAPVSLRAKYLFARHPLTIFAGYLFVFLLGMCLNPFLRSPRKHWDCLVSLAVHVSLGVLLVSRFGWEAWLLVQVLPHTVASAIGSYLFYAQHNFPQVKLVANSGWTYEGAALESSSYMKMHPLMHWFTANIGYHHIHHLNSKIPFYRLPEAMKEVPELQVPKTTSLNPLEMYRCLRLKVWDEDRGEMVGLRDIEDEAAHTHAQAV